MHKKGTQDMFLTGHEKKHSMKHIGILNILIIVAALGALLMGNGITGMAVYDASYAGDAHIFFLEFGLGGIILLGIVITIHHHITHRS